MISWLDRWIFSGCRLSCDMLITVIVQPALVLIMNFYSQDSTLVVSTVSAVVLLIVIGYVRYGGGSRFLYYWMTSSITYIIIVFESVVVPLSEIELEENLILIVFVVFGLLFLYVTKSVPEHRIRQGDNFSNGVLTETCPICRIKTRPRSYHCRICQLCIAKYDYHCYWLSCCIGESNQIFFVAGIVFSILALGYASLLILTTICEPEFVFGILLPKDCSDVGAPIGMFFCFVSGIYCMELAILLIFQLVHQVWLISRGYSALEWKEQFGYNLFRSSPYSRGFIGNWVHLFKSFRKINS